MLVVVRVVVWVVVWVVAIAIVAVVVIGGGSGDGCGDGGNSERDLVSGRCPTVMGYSRICSSVTVAPGNFLSTAFLAALSSWPPPSQLAGAIRRRHVVDGKEA